MMGYNMMGGYGGYGYGTSLFGGVFQSFFSLLFWALILAGMYFLIRWLITAVSSNQSCFLSATPTTPVTALEILKRRYAQGEIDREAYERIKQDLG